jgi:hypothetical protein
MIHRRHHVVAPALEHLLPRLAHRRRRAGGLGRDDLPALPPQLEIERRHHGLQEDVTGLALVS